jgi:hypothetical protein
MSLHETWLDWYGTKKRWSRLFVYAIVLLFLPRSLNTLFRNLLLYKTYFNDYKYTLSTEFVLAQVRGNNHWRTSQVRLKTSMIAPCPCCMFTNLTNWWSLICFVYCLQEYALYRLECFEHFKYFAQDERRNGSKTSQINGKFWEKTAYIKM